MLFRKYFHQRLVGWLDLAGEVDCTAIEPIIARDGVAYYAHDCCVKPEICEIRGTSANCVAPVSSRTPTAAPAAF